MFVSAVNDFFNVGWQGVFDNLNFRDGKRRDGNNQERKKSNEIIGKGMQTMATRGTDRKEKDRKESGSLGRDRRESVSWLSPKTILDTNAMRMWPYIVSYMQQRVECRSKYPRGDRTQILESELSNVP